MTVGELIRLLAQFRPDREVCIYDNDRDLLEPEPPFLIESEDGDVVAVGYMSDPRLYRPRQIQEEIENLRKILESWELTEAQKNSIRLAIAEREAELNTLSKPYTSDF